MYEINGVKTIVHKDIILRLNDKHIEEKSDHKNLWEILINYHSH